MLLCIATYDVLNKDQWVRLHAWHDKLQELYPHSLGKFSTVWAALATFSLVNDVLIRAVTYLTLHGMLLSIFRYPMDVDGVRGSCYLPALR